MDYLNPDYSQIFKDRADRLDRLRSDSTLMAAARVHYRRNPWDFISDWGMTFEPRNIELGRLASIPFIIWPRQKDYLVWLYNKWQSGDRGLVEKSRDCGVTWLSVGFAVSMWCFEPGFTTGFGSRKEELVDKKGDSKSIFEKVRFFLDNIPQEFIPHQFDKRTCSAYMRIVDPHSGSAIIGEAGDEIGRGGRCSIYIVDEAAFIERQEKVDAALSQNTNCQIDISTPNGNGNAFYRKRMKFNNTDRIFIFDWRDDPRKDDAWYEKQREEQDEVTVAQEIDRDYNASAEDAFIPAKWVKASIDAHIKLGFQPSGIRAAGFDPADTGDAKAVVNRHGSVIMDAKQMTSGDITQALPWAFNEADQFRADVFSFDADGMGAPTMKLGLQNLAAGRMRILPYYGSSAVDDPDGKYGSAELNKDDLKTNADTFGNYRSQTATWLRDRFKATYDAVTRADKGMLVKADPEDLISISSECECLHQLVAELSRPRRIWTKNGKILVESKKEMKSRGVQSPNLFDSTVMASAAKPPREKKSIRVNYQQHSVRDRSMGY